MYVCCSEGRKASEEGVKHVPWRNCDGGIEEGKEFIVNVLARV